MPKPHTVALNLPVVELLATHGADELYLGTYEDNRFDSEDVVAALARFKRNLEAAEKEITGRNSDRALKSRSGADALPYTYLIHRFKEGKPNSGILNSISI